MERMTSKALGNGDCLSVSNPKRNGSRCVKSTMLHGLFAKTYIPSRQNSAKMADRIRGGYRISEGRGGGVTVTY